MVLSDERASQSVEFVLLLPLLFVAAALLFTVAIFAAENLAAQTLAGQAARTAAIEGPQAAAHAASAVSNRPVQVTVTTVHPSSDNAPWFNVEVRMPSRVLQRLGMRVELVARASARAQ